MKCILRSEKMITGSNAVISEDYKGSVCGSLEREWMM